MYANVTDLSTTENRVLVCVIWVVFARDFKDGRNRSSVVVKDMSDHLSHLQQTQRTEVTLLLLPGVQLTYPYNSSNHPCWDAITRGRISAFILLDSGTSKDKGLLVRQNKNITKI